MSKIIIVPQAPPPVGETNIPVSGVITYSARDGVRYPVEYSLSARYQPVLTYADVFHDYMAWYGFSGTTMRLSEAEIIRKFWDRRDLIDWIEANATGTVLLQRYWQIGDDGWRIAFSCDTDEARFLSWWKSTDFRGCFEFDVSQTVEKELRGWVHENVRSEKLVRRIGNGSEFNHVKVLVKIKDLTEAAAFRLFYPGTTKQVIHR